MSSARLPRNEGRLSSAADAARRLEAIVEAAERAASKVIDDAEREAQRKLEEAHARADRIVAERLRELADALDAAGENGRGDPIAAGKREQHLRAVDGQNEPGGVEADEEKEDRELRVRPASTPKRGAAAGARLLATQMAVSGAAREEIEARLRTGFEIEDPDPILDAILGPK